MRLFFGLFLDINDMKNKFGECKHCMHSSTIKQLRSYYSVFRVYESCPEYTIIDKFSMRDNNKLLSSYILSYKNNHKNYLSLGILKLKYVKPAFWIVY